MNYRQYKQFVYSDLYRYTEGKQFWKNYFFNAGFKYMFLFRTVKYVSDKKWLYPFFLLLKLRLRHFQFKYGFQIPWNTPIGMGFYIGHCGSVVINGRTIIGHNVNISHNVTIGVVNRGKRKGTAVIGDEVFIGPGAKIIGNVYIGNDVAIGANAVVTKDVPDHAVVVGIPAKVISMQGATGYINRKYNPNNK